MPLNFRPFQRTIRIETDHESISEIEDTQPSVRQQRMAAAKKSKTTAKQKKDATRRHKK